MAEAVSERVLLNWCRGETAEQGEKPAVDDEQFIKRLRLDVAGITANSRALIEATLPIKPGDILAEQTSANGGLAAIDEVFRSEQSSDNLGGGQRILNHRSRK